MAHTAADLFARLDPLPFPARQRLLADTARSLAGTAELAALLADLHARGGIPSRWAVRMATLVADEPHLLRCLTAPDLAVAIPALHTCVRRRLHYTAVADALPGAPKAWRVALCGALRSNRATEWAQRLLPVIRVRFGDREAAAVLAACSLETVTALLPELAYAAPNIAALARLYPVVVLDHLEARLAEATVARRAGIWAQYAGAVAVLAVSLPSRLLDLLEHRGPRTGLPAGLDRGLAALARTDPRRLIAILADADRRIHFRPGRALLLALRAADDESLVLLARSVLGDGQQLTGLLRGLPPSRRNVVLEGALAGRDLVRARVPIAILDLLPWQARHANARTLLATRPVSDDPQLRLEVTARLPWPEAAPVLRAQTARSTAVERALAYPLLIRAAAATRDRDTVGALLASLSRLPNEQDQVRSAALQAIVAMPAWLIAPADTAVIQKITTDALEARDASWRTRNAVNTLAVQLIRQGAVDREQDVVDSGLAILDLAGAQSRTMTLPGLDRDLPRGSENALFGVLRARIEADARHDRYELMLALAAGLGRRAFAMTQLQEHLRRAMSAPNDTTIRRAVDLWLAAPSSRDERVETVLRRDPSTITLTSVADAISRRRTDLLDRVLGKRLRGRFLTADVRFVPNFSGPFEHWLPRQVASYADLMTELATAPKTLVWEEAALVRRLGVLPGIGAGAVRSFLAEREVAVVEAALGVLAWTDRPDKALPELLGYAEGDRARVAVYAATRCARYTPPAELAEALRPVLAGRKVTSRKEAIRLLAEHRAPDALDVFTTLWAEPNLHRDLRRAIVSAVRWSLEDPRSWTLLTEAATSGHAVATALTETAPHTIAERHRAAYGRLVRTVARSADPDTALLGIAAWPDWSPWDSDGASMLITTIADLNSTATWRAAVGALVTACAITGDSSTPRAASDRLAGAADPAGPDRDLPARQRMSYLVEHLAATVDEHGEPARRAAEELADALADDLDQCANAITLAVAALPVRGELSGGLSRIADLADRPVLAWAAADQVAGWLAGHDPDRPELLATATELVAGGSAAALLAVGIAGKVGECLGWPQAWRALITTLRRHPDPDVRLRALDTNTAPE